jgi:hypothetical protein
MNNPDAELARFLSSLSLWLDGMSKFITISKGEWRNAYTGHHLLAQDLRKHTLMLKKQASALSERNGSQDFVKPIHVEASSNKVPL